MAINPASQFVTMRGKPPEEAKFFWTEIGRAHV